MHAFAGKVKVTVAYQPQEGTDIGRMFVAYVSDGGDVERMPHAYDDGKVTFETAHFSVYAVMFDDNAAHSSSGSSAYVCGIVGIVIAACIVIGLMRHWADIRFRS